MRYFVTDSDKEINMDMSDIVVVTTRYEVERRFVERHVAVHHITEVSGVSSYNDKKEREIGEIINKYIEQIITGDSQKIMWDIIMDATDGLFGVSCRKALVAVDDWLELLKQEPEDIIFQISNSNRILCFVGKLIAGQRGISMKFMYNSGIDRVKGSSIHYTWLEKMFQNIVRYKEIITLLFHSKPKQKGNIKKYIFGTVMASNAVRTYQWSIPTLKRQQEVFGKGKYRILCLECDKIYQKLVKDGFPCDKLSEWFDKKVAFNAEREYKKYRRLIYDFVHEKFSFSYQNIDITSIILNFFDHYLWFEKAYHYRLKMIYQSYFAYNSYWCIEPWSTTLFYQVNICCLTSNGAKHCGTNTTPKLCIGEGFYREVYPDFFDYEFFSVIGADLKQSYYDPNHWGKERLYASARYDYFVQAWNRNKDKKEYKGIKNIAILLSCVYPEKILMKTDKIISCLKEFKIICKFHPLLANHSSVQLYIDKKKKEEKNITFVDADKDVLNVIEQADIILTAVSTAMLDTIVMHKVCIVLPDEDEYSMLSFMKDYLNIWSVSELEYKLHQVTKDFESSRIWYQEQLMRQDAFFEENDSLEDAYTQLKRIYDDQQSE